MVTEIKHIYEVRPRKDHRGVDLIFDALPFGRLTHTLSALQRGLQLHSMALSVTQRAYLKD